MEGRLTPVLGLTKVPTSSRLDARVANDRVRTINADLDILDAAIGALEGGGGGGPPTGPAGGDLSGTYPNPTIAAGAVGPAEVAGGTYAISVSGNAATATTALGAPPTGAAGGSLNGTYPAPGIANGAVTDAQVAAANKDGTAGTPAMRTLGTGAQQAAAGDHAHAGMMTNPMTTPQDIVVGGTAGTPTRLGVGANTQVLTVVGGVLTWAAPVSGGMTNPMTTLGDLITGGAAGAPGRLGVGAEGQVLAVSSGAPAWAAPAATETLLVNGGCEVWQRGAGPFTANNAYTADRWQIQLGTGTVSVTRESALVDTGSAYALAAVVSGGGTGAALVQVLEHAAQLRGRTVTFAVRVRSSVAGVAKAGVFTGTGWTEGAANTGTGAYETLSVTVAVPAASSALWVRCNVAGAATVYLDNATLVVGSTAAPYVPLHPADDLARCQRYYQELGGLFANEYVCPMLAYAAGSAFGVFFLPVEMAGTPTVTGSAPGDFAVTNAAGSTQAVTALSFSNQTRRAARVSVNTSGLVAGDASFMITLSTNARIRFEINP